MRIGMRIDANAHQSVNAQICIECALQVLCEQASSWIPNLRFQQRDTISTFELPKAIPL